MIKDKSNELIDSHVSTKQCKKAINALHSHALKIQAENEEKELLGEKEQNIWLTIGVKKVYPEKKLKPHKM
jgi:ribosome biogenesis protein UTP30